MMKLLTATITVSLHDEEEPWEVDDDEFERRIAHVESNIKARIERVQEEFSDLKFEVKYE